MLKPRRRFLGTRRRQTMRNLSSSELAQISGGRRAQSTMLGNATHNNVFQPAEENFWTWNGSGFSGATSWNLYSPYVPNSSASYGVFEMGASSFGLYSQSSGFLGALTYNPSGNYYSGTVIDTVGNFQVSGTLSSNHSVGFTVKYSY